MVFTFMPHMHLLSNDMQCRYINEIVHHLPDVLLSMADFEFN